MAEENPNILPSENEIIENDEFGISSTTYTGRELQIFRNNNNDNSTNNNNTMMVSIQNLGESSQNLSVQVTSTSSTFTTRITMNNNQISTPDVASIDDYESENDYSDVDNNDRDDTSPDSQDNSNNNGTEIESDAPTDTASSCGEIDSTSKPITDEDEEKETRKRTIKPDVKPKKRFKKDDNIPDI